jgi:hypothetical protein
MAAAPNRDAHIMFPGEMYGRHHVGDIGALGNQTRLAIDHRVIHFALFVVTRVGRLNQIAPELTFEFEYILRLHCFLHSGHVPLPKFLIESQVSSGGRYLFCPVKYNNVTSMNWFREGRGLFGPAAPVENPRAFRATLPTAPVR